MRRKIFAAIASREDGIELTAGAELWRDHRRG